MPVWWSQPKSAHVIPLILRYSPESVFHPVFEILLCTGLIEVLINTLSKAAAVYLNEEKQGARKVSHLVLQALLELLHSVLQETAVVCSSLQVRALRHEKFPGCTWRTQSSNLKASAKTQAKYIPKHSPVRELSMFRWTFESLLQVADIAETLLWNDNICCVTAGCASVVLLCHDTSGFDVLLLHFPHWFNQFTSSIFS